MSGLRGWLWLGTAVLLLLAAWGETAVRAHGGGEIQIAGAPVGPYKVSAWLNPPQPRAEETAHITVGVARPPRDEPVLDATVDVTITPQAGDDPVLVSEATTAASVNKLFYETDFPAPAAGDYTVLLQVAGDEGNGRVTFPITVVPPGGPNWFVIGLTALLLVGGIIIFANQRR